MTTTMIPGEAVAVREMRAIEFNDGGKARRWFRVDFPRKREHSVVLMGGLLPDGKIVCSEHQEDCDCRKAVRAFMEDES
jgi:hypothetical protein